MAVHLRLYSGDDTLLGFLPDARAITVQDELNQTGSGSFTYPRVGRNADLLLAQDDARIAVIEDGQERFRWLVEDDTDDPSGPASRDIDVSGRGALALLERGRVLPPGGVGHTPAVVVFDQPTSIGRVIRTLVEANQELGFLTDIALGFTDTADSSGDDWANYWSGTYDAGVSLLDVVTALASLGLCDVRMAGPTLQVYNPQTDMGRDRDTVYVRRQHLTAAPRQRSRRELYSDVLVIGENGVNMLRSDPTSGARYGRRLGHFGQGNASQPSTLATLGDTALKEHSRPAEGYTLDLQFQTDGCPHPYRDFWLGDYVRCDLVSADEGGFEPLRVRSIALTYSPTSGLVSGSVEVNDRFLETIVKLRRRVDGIVNGSISDSSGLPSNDPANDPIDGLAPKPPTSLTITSAAYVAERGNVLADTNLQWLPPFQNTDGTALTDLDHYDVAWRYSTGPDTEWRGFRLDGSVNAVSLGGLAPARNVEARVRAGDWNGNTSAWTDTAGHLTASDEAPPPKSSAALIEEVMGQLRITWDGLGDEGEAMPPDFDRLVVHVSPTSGFTPTAATRRTDLFGPGTYISGGDWDQRLYVKFVAYDTTGNGSVPSDERSGVIRRISGVDLADQAVSTRHIAERAVGALQVDFTAGEIGGVRVTRDTEPHDDPNHDDVWIDTTDGANRLHTWDADTGQWVSARDAGITQAVQAAEGAVVAANGKNRNYYQPDPPPANTPGLAVRDTWFDTNDGNRPYRWDGSGWIPATWGDGAIAQINAGKITAGVLSADRIGAASITSGKIAAGAITAGKIAAGAVNTTTLTVGAVTDNLLRNGGFEDLDDEGMPVEWVRDTAGAYSGAMYGTATGTAALSGAASLTARGAPGGTSRGYSRIGVPVAAGTTYYASARVRGSGSAPGSAVGVHIFWYTAEGGFRSNAAGYSALTTDAQRVVVTGEAPADAKFARVALYTYTPAAGIDVTWDDVELRQVVGSAMIADATILTAKIADLAVTAAKIAALSVTNAKIADLAVDDAKIANLDGGKITAQSITAEQISVGTLGDNLVINPSVEEVGGGWELRWRGSGAAEFHPSAALSGQRGARLTAAPNDPATGDFNSSDIIGQWVPIVPGAEYRVQVHHRASTPTTRGFFLRVEVADDDSGTNTEWLDTGYLNSGVGVQWESAGDIVTVPAGKAWGRIRVWHEHPDVPAHLHLDDFALVQIGTGAAQYDRTGLRVWDAAGNLAIDLSAKPSGNYVSISSGGETVATLDSDGVVSGQVVTATRDLMVAGSSVVGNRFAEWAPGIGAHPGYDAMFDALPWGMVEWGAFYERAPGTNNAGGIGIMEIMVPTYYGRMYRLQTSALRVRHNTDRLYCEVSMLRVRGDIGDTNSIPPSPTINSQDLARIQQTVFSGPLGEGMVISKLYSPGPGNSGFFANVRVLLVLSVPEAGGTAYVDGSQLDPIEFWCEDIGPYKVHGGQINRGGGGITGGATTPAPATVPRRTYTRRYHATWTRTYDQGGGVVSTSEAVQGYWSGRNGAQRAMYGFPASRIRADTAGADIISCRLFMYATHWYYNSGGTAVIGVHSTDSPGGFQADPRVQSANWPKPGGRVVNLGVAVGQMFRDGSARGISLGPVSTNRLFYGKFAGHTAAAAKQPYVEITYAR